jgi:hypothetical protein
MYLKDSFFQHETYYIYIRGLFSVFCDALHLRSYLQAMIFRPTCESMPNFFPRYWC